MKIVITNSQIVNKMKQVIEKTVSTDVSVAMLDDTIVEGVTLYYTLSIDSTNVTGNGIETNVYIGYGKSDEQINIAKFIDMANTPITINPNAIVSGSVKINKEIPLDCRVKVGFLPSAGKDVKFTINYHI